METVITNGTIKINGNDVKYDFGGKYELHLDPFKYGTFDIIGKKTDDSHEEVLYKNAAVSFINPNGDDENLIRVVTQIEHSNNEPYIVDCATYQKICTIKNIIELKSSK